MINKAVSILLPYDPEDQRSWALAIAGSRYYDLIFGHKFSWSSISTWISPFQLRQSQRNGQLSSELWASSIGFQKTSASVWHSITLCQGHLYIHHCINIGITPGHNTTRVHPMSRCQLLQILKAILWRIRHVLSLMPRNLMQCYNRWPHHQQSAHTLQHLASTDCRPQLPAYEDMRLIVESCIITVSTIYLCPEDTYIREQRDNNDQSTNRLGPIGISIYSGLARHTGDNYKLNIKYRKITHITITLSIIYHYH